MFPSSDAGFDSDSSAQLLNFILSVLIGFSCLAVAYAQSPSVWHDPSKHRVQFVTVEGGVRLEVLDWGGTGRPIVLLAGYQTAHEYDDIAPKLSEIGHVYGITRRGYGASSRPDYGYSAQRSADDVLQVLER
jgi:hypothetical protein